MAEALSAMHVQYSTSGFLSLPSRWSVALNCCRSNLNDENYDYFSLICSSYQK